MPRSARWALVACGALGCATSSSATSSSSSASGVLETSIHLPASASPSPAPPSGSAPAPVFPPVAPTAGGAPAPLVAITDVGVLRAICDALTPPARRVGAAATEEKRAEALRIHGARYEAALTTALGVQMKGSEVSLAWDARGEVAAVPLRAGLRAFRGALVLQLTDSFEGGALEIPVASEAAEAAGRARAAGAVSVRVVVLPDPDTMLGAACYSYPGSDAYTLHGELLEAALVSAGDGLVLGRVRTTLYARWSERLALAAASAAARKPGPRVVVSKVRLASGAMPPGALGELPALLADRLLPCYRKALETAPHVAGSLVVSVTVDTKGRVREAHVTIDALHAADLATCVVGVVSSAPLPRASSGAAVLDLPIVFEP